MSTGVAAILTKRYLPGVFVLMGGIASASAAVEEVDLQVQGMKCPLCVRGVEESVGRLPGVGTVEADLGTGRVRVMAQIGKSLDLRSIREQVVRSGFEAAREPVLVHATGTVNHGPHDRLTFRVSGTNEVYDLLEGAQLRRLLLTLPVAGPPPRVALTGRLHGHPERLPPSFSILSYEVKTP